MAKVFLLRKNAKFTNLEATYTDFLDMTLAVENTVKLTDVANVLGKPTFTNICSYLNSPFHMDMWILSNEEGWYGAAHIVNTETLQMVANELKSNFFVLPSSVHEVLCLPYDGNPQDKADVLRCIVESVNRDVVSPEEFLSDSVYWFNGKELEIV